MIRRKFYTDVICILSRTLQVTQVQAGVGSQTNKRTHTHKRKTRVKEIFSEDARACITKCSILHSRLHN